MRGENTEALFCFLAASESVRSVSSSSNKKYERKQQKEPGNNILAQYLASLNLGRAFTFPPLAHSIEEKGLSDKEIEIKEPQKRPRNA